MRRGRRPTSELTYTKPGRNAAYIFLAGVLTIVVFGLFPDLRPHDRRGEDGTTEPIGVTPIIQMVMFTVAALILLISKPKAKEIPESSVFKAGIVSAIALFGLAWLTDTFIGEWETADRRHRRRLGERLQVGVLLRRVPRRRADHEPVDGDPDDRADRPRRRPVTRRSISGMWAGGFAGVFTLPTNGSQIAAANFDETGTTKLGTKLVDHSFIMPVILLGVTTAIPGVIIGGIFDCRSPADRLARTRSTRVCKAGPSLASIDTPKGSAMNDQELLDFVSDVWDHDIMPTLHEYITIPNVSPVFEADWEELGHMERAVDAARRLGAAPADRGHDSSRSTGSRADAGDLRRDPAGQRRLRRRHRASSTATSTSSPSCSAGAKGSGRGRR